MTTREEFVEGGTVCSVDDCELRALFMIYDPDEESMVTYCLGHLPLDNLDNVATMARFAGAGVVEILEGVNAQTSRLDELGTLEDRVADLEAQISTFTKAPGTN
ncbi:hypothetical protein LCGC14_1524000 [marine sediment metagenome]|uniref:Uncharacterized protein n=1 Tax=marine sediment metagenome TaxID=412755 RepID=A0A0F9IXY8_9ZZZZ